ncbi:unnamed protein product [Rotaria sp. Silwood2]|nr:unnamed protein product [Rotaria sp. Silwood2]
MRLIDKYCQIYPEWMMKFGTPKMDPPSMSINEILHRKAQDAWIHPDNYNDTLRYFPVVQNPMNEITIDINEQDTALE